MLSIENPPPDPPFPCQLKSGSDDQIEKASHNLPLPEVDLLKQPPLHLTPPSKFSIRDYVFCARSKDIKKSWPFSFKNLQLCLKHGVKDPLPPFQHLDTVRNPSSTGCTGEDQNTNKFDGSSHHMVLESSNDSQSIHNLEIICVDNNSSCRSGGENDNDFPSTSVSQSEIESVPFDKPSKSPLGTDTSVEASAEVEATIPSKSLRTENTVRSSGKKCRYIVKFGANSDRSLTEDIAPNFSLVSVSMASQVCPVCKTFSSSSNTTMNAHMDQCLSVESTPKWTVDSKLTRHRIKSRKTRLMVDIYTTAKHCTLEELDKRNGTSWATGFSMPVQNSEKLEASDERKKHVRASPVPLEDDADVGTVYVDANGTKVRILSKFNESLSTSKLREDLERKKSLKGGKRSKFFSRKKKRRHEFKHLKHLKHSTQSRKFLSQKAPASKMVGDQDGYCAMETTLKDEEHWIRNEIKSSWSGNLGKRVCSKRTGIARKVKCQDSLQPLFCKWHVSSDLPAQTDQAGFADPVVKRNGKFKTLYENLLSSPENSGRTDKHLNESQAIDEAEHSCSRKRVRSPLIEAKVANKGEMCSPAVKRNKNQLSEDVHCTDESQVLRPPNFASSLSNKTIGIEASSDPDSPLDSSSSPAISPYVFSSKFITIPSLKKNSLSTSSRSSVVAPTPNSVKNCSITKKGRLHFLEEIDEVPQAWEREVEQQQRESVSTCRRDETIALKSSEPASCYSDHYEGGNSDSSVSADDDILDNFDGSESVEEMVTSPSKSSETKCHNLSDPSKSRSNCLRTIEAYNRALCGDEALPDAIGSSFIDRREMFSTDEVGHDMIGNAHVGAELMNSEAAQGDIFPEVDPIPIPGPPGSFLPSPRAMNSDDFQGNSSLTTSRAQSSQDLLDLVDGDSSDSPVSAASTISNPIATKSDLRYSESLTSAGAALVEEKIVSGFSSTNTRPPVENAIMVMQTSTVPERAFDGEKNRVHRIFVEKRPFILKNDDQPCCCQRKEKSSQGIALNFQQSPLLKRRAMASVTMPAMEMKMDTSPNIGPNNLDVKPGAFSLSSSTSSVPQKVVLPAMRPLASPTPSKGCMDAGVKYPGQADCESASPSCSTPVLRLMGKDLMVANKDDASVPVGQSQQCRPSNHFPTSGISQGIIRNQDCQSFRHRVPLDSSTFGQLPHNMVGPSFDVRLSNSYAYLETAGTPQIPEISVARFQDQCMEHGFSTFMEPYKCESNYISPTRQNKPKAKVGLPSTCATGKFTSLDCQEKYSDPAASIKEIIVLDGAPENETSTAADIAKHYEGLRGSQLMLPGVSIAIATSDGLRHVNPFSCYQSKESTYLGKPQGGSNTSFRSVPLGQANTSADRWGCTTSEGSGVLHGSPFVAALPSTGHLTPSLYYPPSLS
ncbi:hypothetical protein SLEP1_g20133 [Rubroshorea leprosula]|uniref:Uncharacterized protein n=1 Tax=Rubroshorea leprosula TaxID=152421 RepID=A0AAV5JC65_9ROSI|nr:hypothetical protein SLEP1_g20133 [Rubroshorea leprosula]